MVEAYEHNELADNSADEKRMEKAKKEAERTEENEVKSPVFGQRGAGAEKAAPLGAFRKNRGPG